MPKVQKIARSGHTDYRIRSFVLKASRAKTITASCPLEPQHSHKCSQRERRRERKIQQKRKYQKSDARAFSFWGKQFLKCDPSGRFFNVLVTEFSDTRSPKNWKLFGLLWKTIPFRLQLIRLLFGQLFENLLCYLFFQYLVTLEGILFKCVQYARQSMKPGMNATKMEVLQMASGPSEAQAYQFGLKRIKVSIMA